MLSNDDDGMDSLQPGGPLKLLVFETLLASQCLTPLTSLLPTLSQALWLSCLYICSTDSVLCKRNQIKEHRSMYSKYMNIFTLSLSYKYIYSKFTKNPDSLYEEHHIQIYSG